MSLQLASDFSLQERRNGMPLIRGLGKYTIGAGRAGKKSSSTHGTPTLRS
jgi:hypothetical protein